MSPSFWQKDSLKNDSSRSLRPAVSSTCHQIFNQDDVLNHLRLLCKGRALPYRRASPASLFRGWLRSSAACGVGREPHLLINKRSTSYSWCQQNSSELSWLQKEISYMKSVYFSWCSIIWNFLWFSHNLKTYFVKNSISAKNMRGGQNLPPPFQARVKRV